MVSLRQRCASLSGAWVLLLGCFTEDFARYLPKVSSYASDLPDTIGEFSSPAKIATNCTDSASNSRVPGEAGKFETALASQQASLVVVTFIIVGLFLALSSQTVNKGEACQDAPKPPRRANLRSRAIVRQCMTAELEPKMLAPLWMTDVRPDVMPNIFFKWAREEPEVEQLADTATNVWKQLSSSSGGVIVAVVGEVCIKQLPGRFQYLDNGHFTRLLRTQAPKITEHPDAFNTLLGAYRRHTCSDRWEQDLLAEVATALGKTRPDEVPGLQQLLDEPKDGAMILSQRGTVLAASARLNFDSEVWQLKRKDGTQVGTRHAAALGLAEFMDAENVPGVVFVCSDTGHSSVLLPTANGIQAYSSGHHDLPAIQEQSDSTN